MAFDYDVYTDNRAHGEDAHQVREWNNCLLVAVADGVSSSQKGALASRLVCELALTVFERCYLPQVLLTSTLRTDCRNDRCRRDGLQHRFGTPEAEKARRLTFSRYLEELMSSLCRLPERLDQPEQSGTAHTTLTAAVFERDGDGGTAYYAAWGDSPILLAYPQAIMDRAADTYLTLQIHGKPLVVQNPGRIYSFIDVANGVAFGRPSIGSFKLQSKDICLVMTDGVPYQKYITKDISCSGPNHRLLNGVRNHGVKSALGAFAGRLATEASLIDDATLAVVHVSEQRLILTNP